MTALQIPQPVCSEHPVAAAQNSTGAQRQEITGKGELPKSMQKGRRRQHQQRTLQNNYLQSIPQAAEDEEEEMGENWEAKKKTCSVSLQLGQG